MASDEESMSVWEFLNVLKDTNLSPDHTPYPPPELRGVEDYLVDGFILDRTGFSPRVGIDFGSGRISTPYWEAREVYGDDTARMMLERGREYAENPPDVPQHVLDNSLLPPHDTESARKWGTPVPVSTLEEGWNLGNAAAITSSSSKEDNPHGLPFSVILPAKGSRYDSDATIAHEFTHAGIEWGGGDRAAAISGERRGLLRNSLISSYKRRIGDSLTDDRMHEYLSGVNYILESSREATASLSGAVRTYGSVHGRPPATEDEVLDAIREDGERRSGNSPDEHSDFSQGITDALLGLPWTRRIGKHLVKNEATEGGFSYA